MNRSVFSPAGSTLLLLAAIVAGSVTGWASPAIGAWLGGRVDPLILALVSLLFFEVDFTALRRVPAHWRCLALAWGSNFLLIPALGWGLASLFLHGQPLFYTGLVIYFMAPCTDWFLGFTRMARGNVVLGSVLLPVQLLTQLLLFPVYLGLFAGAQTGVDAGGAAASLWQWFVLPCAGAIAARLLLARVLPTRVFAALQTGTGRAVPPVIAALTACIFAANIGTLLEHAGTFLLILAAVFVFFIATWWLTERISRGARLAYPEHALLTMTTAARNAPLMLGLTMSALPDQPLVYAALIIGMLVEFPHLTVLQHLLLRRAGAPPPPPRDTAAAQGSSTVTPPDAEPLNA